MASKTQDKTNRALRDMLINQMREIVEIANTAKEEAVFKSLLKRRIGRAREILEQFLTLQSAIITHLSTQADADLPAEESIRTVVQGYFDTIEVTYLQLFPDVEHPTTPDITSNTSGGSLSNLRLPKLSLRTFDGNFNEWTPFIQFYNNAIHNRLELSNIEKFQYLISSLSQEPLNMVKSISLSNDNYEIAYNALVDRYENKRKLSYYYWNAINALPKLKLESARGLRELLDKFKENRSALQALKITTSLEDFMWFQLLLERIDPETRKAFEAEIRELSADKVPAFQELTNFVESQCRVLEAVPKQQEPSFFNRSRLQTKSHGTPSKVFSKQVLLVDSQSNTSNRCILCEDKHRIHKCPKLASQTPAERFTTVKSLNLCVNCLSSTHRIKSCASKVVCRSCQGKHHSLLHFPNSRANSRERISKESVTNSTSSAVTYVNQDHASGEEAISQNLTTLASSLSTNVILLATALIEVQDSRGNFQLVRAVLDSGSQGSFVTRACLARLNLKINPSKIQVRGINSKTNITSPGYADCVIRSRFQNQPLGTVRAHILPKIINNSRSAMSVDPSNWQHLKSLPLADPEYHKAREIDVLLGSDIYAYLLRPGVTHGRTLKEPSAIETIFGWVITGKTGQSSPEITNTLFTTIDTEDLQEAVKSFWELEEIPTKLPEDKDTITCNTLFSKSLVRDNKSGRYTVSLPFKVDNPVFPNSRDIALRRFLLLERRLSRDPVLRRDYHLFLADYLQSGHMSLATPSPGLNRSYFIPHHCVIKPDSSTTRLRVVFDASARASNGVSLNDTLYAGPKLQKDIVAVLLNFRLHNIVFTADIRQMFRQIRISPPDRHYQKILWRFSPDQPIEEYFLNTVTYGVASSPYLAIRTLIQLADDEQNRYSLAAEVLKRDLYVDDIATGCATIEQALALQKQLILLLQSGQFELRKWASNSEELLNHLNPDFRQDTINFDTGETNSPIKILGLQWIPSTDTFSFNVQPIERSCTKRHILSELARVFDPLGFLTPLTLMAKRIIQHLWCLGLGWDDQPPSDVVARWAEYRSQLPLIREIGIPRQVSSPDLERCELHGFCDASESGFAAVAYVRVVNSRMESSVQFVIAKSKVAPIKRRSLPQLELCGAQLLAKLLAFVMSTYSGRFNSDSIYAWTDNMTVLAWIRSSPHRWNVFVGNRVSYIQERVPPSCWRHVPSADNPADCASRGLLPAELKSHPLWWTGPGWLQQTHNYWPKQEVGLAPAELDIVQQEERRVVLMTHVTAPAFLESLIRSHSKLALLQNTLAWMRRFVGNCRLAAQSRHYGGLTPQEKQAALDVLIKYVQGVEFAPELRQLKGGQICSKPFRKLAPFLDPGGLIRVGGRLSNSALSFNQRHPALLPRNNWLTKLIIEHIHIRYLHPGVKTVHFLMSQNYWIPAALQTIRSILANCHVCFRQNPKSLQPPMGNLPAFRVRQAKAFQGVGIDFGGPFTITMNRTRGGKTMKAYLCLFVCVATKAVHLELASDLSTEAFLAALRRFLARRGRCSHIYSDCGTNFVGAAAQIRLMREAVQGEGITWNFNPPSAPHFGGLWEAGIKSAKSHLRRVIGDQILTFEELYTVLTQIEAVLNSRPLYAQSTDPNDMSVLTPGHFLTMAPLTCLPDFDLTNIKRNRLTRWQLLQQLHHSFWNRWHREYLHTMQQRCKWHKNSLNLAPGTLVLIKSEQSPPLQWKLGRVETAHPGKDGVVRVATVRTASGLVQRPVVKLCPLPQVTDEKA